MSDIRQSRVRRCGIITLIVLLLFGVACGGKGKGGGDEVTLTGSVSRRGSTPMSALVFETKDGQSYIIEASYLGEELASLEGMELAVTGKFVSTLKDGTKVFSVVYYDLLTLPSGERPVVGIIRYAEDAVYIRDHGDVVWLLRGEFEDVLKTFNGAKVWVVGTTMQRVNTAVGAMRVILVTDYGVISP